MDAAPTSQPQVIDADIPCFGCRYNLRSRSLEDRCPECGRPVIDAFRGGWLCFADKNWLWRLHRGTSVIGLTALLLVLGTAGLLLVTVILQAAGLFKWWPLTSLLTSAIFYGGSLRAAWLLSSSDPISKSAQKPSGRLKYIRSLFLMATFLGVLVNSSIYHDMMRWFNEIAVFFILVLKFITWTTYFGGVLLLLLVLRSIALRDAGGTHVARILGYVTGGFMVIALGFVIIEAIVFSMVSSPRVMPATGPTTLGATGASSQIFVYTAGPVTTSAPTSAPFVPPRRISSTALLLLSQTACLFPSLVLVWLIAATVAIVQFRRLIFRAIHDPLRNTPTAQFASVVA